MYADPGSSAMATVAEQMVDSSKRIFVFMDLCFFKKWEDIAYFFGGASFITLALMILTS